MRSLPLLFALEACSPTPAPRDVTAQLDRSFVYEVEKGDHLEAIARRFGDDLKGLIERNHVSNPDVIEPGQRLEIQGHWSTVENLNTLPRPQPEMNDYGVKIDDEWFLSVDETAAGAEPFPRAKLGESSGLGRITSSSKTSCLLF